MHHARAPVPGDDPPPAPLPQTVAGLSHRAIALRARGIIAAADERQRRGRGDTDDPWVRRMDATGVLDADAQRILVAATRLDATAITDARTRAELATSCRELLVAAVRRLIIAQAHSLAGATHVTSRAARLEELVALGEVAVLERIDTFDLTHSATFATYISWWSHQAMQRYTYRESSPATVPEHIQVDASRLHRILKEYAAGGIHPGLAELSEQMSARSGRPFTIEQIRRLRAVLRSRHPISLSSEVTVFDGALRVEGAAHIMREDEQADPTLRAPDADLEAADLADVVQAAIDADLGPEQAAVIRARFGIAGDALSPECIQAQLGISKGSYDGLKERGERALALRLAIVQRPGYLAEAMAEMEPDDAEVLRLAHGLDFAGTRTADPLTPAQIAAALDIDLDAVARALRTAERTAVLLMTRILPAERPRRHGVEDAGELTPDP